jgi:hypothetical protein
MWYPLQALRRRFRSAPKPVRCKPSIARPALEALEDRCCPCHSYFDPYSSTLYTYADSLRCGGEIYFGANLFFNFSTSLFLGGSAGNSASGESAYPTQVDVTVNDEPTESYIGVRRVVVVGGNRNDRLTVHLQQSLDDDLVFEANLGDGDDVVNVATYAPGEASPPDAAGATRIDIFAGAGNDQLNVTVGDPSIKGLPQQLKGDLSVNLHGGAGSDHGFILNWNVAVQGRLSEAINLGAEDDYGTIDSYRVGGTLLTSISGDAGNDTMNQHLSDGTGAWTTSMIGGAGDDNGSIIVHFFQGDASVSMNEGDGIGDDDMNIELSESAGTFATVMNSGSGADIGSMYVTGFAGALTTSMSGGRGDDSLTVNASDITGAQAWSLDAGSGADLVGFIVIGGKGILASLINLGGGNDNCDVIINWFEGGEPFPGLVQLTIDGSSGNDWIDAKVNLANQPGIAANIFILGGYGDDRLALNVVGVDDPGILDALVDGGAGFDIARRAPGVLYRNVEAYE